MGKNIETTELPWHLGLLWHLGHFSHAIMMKRDWPSDTIGGENNSATRLEVWQIQNLQIQPTCRRTLQPRKCLRTRRTIANSILWYNSESVRGPWRKRGFYSTSSFDVHRRHEVAPCSFFVLGPVEYMDFGNRAVIVSSESPWNLDFVALEIAGGNFCGPAWHACTYNIEYN